jgi:hypothetical protein
MTAFDVLAMIFVLPFGVLFLAGGLAISLSDWEKRPGGTSAATSAPEPRRA